MPEMSGYAFPFILTLSKERNMTRTKFTVHYWTDKRSHVARFTNERDARDFGAFVSRRGNSLVEMSDKTGLIGQWDCGAVTPEFFHTIEN